MLEIEADDHVLAHVRFDERAHAAAADETMGDGRGRDAGEHVVQQPALDLPQPRLGRLQQAVTPGCLGHPPVAVVLQRLSRRSWR